MSNPIFVVGCDRSGTTLLRLILTQHPDVIIAPEATFIHDLYDRWQVSSLQSIADVDAFITAINTDKKFVQWGLDKKELQNRLNSSLPLEYHEALTHIYEAYRDQTKPYANRWGDKHPLNTLHLREIWSVFPLAQVVHIVRDGRAVFNSFRKTNQKRNKTVWPNEPYTAAHYWKRFTRATRKLDHQDNYMEIHYEDLTTEPETTMLQTCQFLQLEYDADMLKYYDSEKKLDLIPEDQQEIHTNISKPLLADRNVAWSSELEPIDVIRFEMMAGAELVRNGYEVYSSSLFTFLWKYRVVNYLINFSHRIYHYLKRNFIPNRKT